MYNVPPKGACASLAAIFNEGDTMHTYTARTLASGKEILLWYSIDRREKKFRGGFQPRARTSEPAQWWLSGGGGGGAHHSTLSVSHFPGVVSVYLCVIH